MKKWICVVLAVGMVFLGSLVIYANVAGDTADQSAMTMTRPDPDEDFSITITRPDPDEDF